MSAGLWVFIVIVLVIIIGVICWAVVDSQGDLRKFEPKKKHKVPELFTYTIEGEGNDQYANVVISDNYRNLDWENYYVPEPQATYNGIDVTSYANMFSGMSKVTQFNLQQFTNPNITNLSGMFRGCYDLVNINMENMQLTGLIDQVTALTTGGLDKAKAEKVQKLFENMFDDCGKLSQLTLYRDPSKKGDDNVIEGLHNVAQALGGDANDVSVFTKVFGYNDAPAISEVTVGKTDHSYVITITHSSA